ncbi:MAG: ABC transporter permease [Promethearchaeia archaeon]
MKRDKAKTIFGVIGIAISIFLLSAIGMLNDTINYNYVQVLTTTTGDADILVTRSIDVDVTYDPFFDEAIIDDKLQDIEGIDEFYPRIMMPVETSSEKTSANGTLQMYGMDFQKEANTSRMGDLLLVDENGEPTGEKYEDEPGNGECVILYKVAELLNVSKGDTINIGYQQHNDSVEVVGICEQDLKFMEFEKALILVNLDFAQDFLEKDGKINMIYGTFNNPEDLYDASDLTATTRNLRRLGDKIQERLDINEYQVALPKLEELEGGEFLLMGTTIIFWFITILSMLITGILINSILSTSVEERIREFGILRVVGGQKKFPVKMVLFEGFLLGLIGSIGGIVAGISLTPSIAESIFTLLEFEFSDIQFIINPEMLLIGFGIGTVVSLLVALLPSLKAARMDLIKSITPFQTKEEGWEVKKEGSVNVKSFLVGISIATIGMIIFIVMPQIFVTGEMMLIAGLFIFLLAAILIGLVFASVGVVPLIQRIFLGIISPAIKKYANIIKISLKRYRRRNTSTVVMFAISFSFIFFITSYTEMNSDNLAQNFSFQYGSDLVLVNQGGEDSGITQDMMKDLRQIGGVDQVSYSLHNTFDVQAALSVGFSVAEGGSGFEDNSAEQQINDLLQYYSTQGQEKYETEVADISNTDSVSAGFIGVGQDFADMVDQDMLIWKSPNSGFENSFNKMLNKNNTCILAKSIADTIGVDEVGEELRLTLRDPQKENDPGNVTVLEVAGISGGIPGFWNFRSSEYSASGGGVMVSLDNYMRLMDVENARQPEMVIDKVFIDLLENTEENIKQTKEDIEARFKDKSFIIDDAISKINYMDEMSQRQSLLMEIVLMFTVMICVFGLISNMYSIMLERKFEIGILRSMGMKSKNVRNMFLLESMIIMLSAGIMGTLIGSYTAYLMETNIALLTEMPVIYSVPVDTLLRVFIISVSVGIVGMYIILLKLSRQSIMDIFRQSF